ncbi:MAG: signal recognition particle-docking protein FtsY [candidate division KSB1 bacterium]|nr:signal recognition particle-docking protein FtsY [candidate division KSB1 bacterium]MDZ7346553.1 signal recognition particle-docking protein FtsY [candidate division KSB1 bacterium]
MFDLLAKFTQGLAKTRQGFVEGLARITGGRVIDESQMEELEELLLLSDIGVDTAERVIASLRRRLREQDAAGDLVEQLKGVLQEQLQVSSLTPPTKKPWVVSVVGVNGSGKTTTIGKLAHYYRAQGKKVLLAAADTFRAAAIDQLQIWAERAGAELIRTQPGADPAAVAFDALKAAVARDCDVLLIDTAGRLHTKSNLMAELAKIHRVLKRQDAEAPHEVLLVLDAATGRNGLTQAKQFLEAAGVTGLVLTKLDGTAKGGIVFSISQELGLPVKFIGVGEQIDDLAPFDPKTFVDALFQ